MKVKGINSEITQAMMSGKILICTDNLEHPVFVFYLKWVTSGEFHCATNNINIDYIEHQPLWDYKPGWLTNWYWEIYTPAPAPAEPELPEMIKNPGDATSTVDLDQNRTINTMIACMKAHGWK